MTFLTIIPGQSLRIHSLVQLHFLVVDGHHLVDLIVVRQLLRGTLVFLALLQLVVIVADPAVAIRV